MRQLEFQLLAELQRTNPQLILLVAAEYQRYSVSPLRDGVASSDTTFACKLTSSLPIHSCLTCRVEP